MTIRLQFIIGFFLLILVFVFIFFVNQRLSKQVLTNTTYLNNSEAVIRNSNMIHKNIIEMQSAFRGFLLTEQENFLTPYYEGLKEIPALMTSQKAMISDKYQKQTLDSISILHAQWIEYTDSLIATKKDTLPESNIKYTRLFNEKFRMEVGEKLIRRIRTMFADFDSFEYELRAKRRTKLQRSIRDTWYVSLFVTFGAIALVLFAGIYFVRLIVTRISKMVNLAEKISSGDFVSIHDEKRDELGRLVTALNQMSATLEKNFQELKSKNDELDQFAYVVSHDLKAPLRGISNLVSWIEEDHPEQIGPEVNQNLQLIKGRVFRLENMINGLLEYARIDKIKKEEERIDVNELIEDIREMIVPPNVQLRVADLPLVFAQRHQLEHILSNLISNAVKHNKSAAPVVTINGIETEKDYEFSVSDNGQGIEKEYFGKIFIIFQTLQERDAFESTGVGLAIVKKIIDDIKGTIRVESTLGKGTTFIFTLPKPKN